MHGEWSETMQSMVPSASPCHSSSRLPASRIGGQHLNCVAPAGISSADERQVVRAGLDGEPHAVALGGGDHRQRVRAGQVQDVRAGTGPSGAFDDLGDGECSRRRAGRDARKSAYRSPSARRCTVDAVGVLGVHDHQRVERRRSRAVPARSSSGSSGGNSSTPDASRKHLKPNTPASCSARRSRHVAGNRAAPEPDVDVAPARPPLALDLERVDVDGRRDAVERHVDDRRDPAGGGRPGRGGEPLPLGAAGLVDVDVGVDQSGDQHLVGAELHDPLGFECGVQRFDGDDATVANADRARDFAGRCDHAGRAEDQVEGLIHRLSVLGSVTGVRGGDEPR